MRNVDNRVVGLYFNNKQFEKGINESLHSLEQLNKSIDSPQASYGLEELAGSVDTVADRFSTMGVIGMTVLQQLTIYAMQAGRNIARSIIGPITEGGKRRALNIEAAKFQFEGLSMDIEAAMESANQAVLGTAFGLDEAAKVASQLGASGMEAGDEMTKALRGISGVAAMTSSSYEDIGNIFTAVSGQGRVMGNQLLQLSGRGLNAAAALSKSLGISEQEVREMVSKGMISFEMFYTAMDDAFGEHATAANKTFTGALSNMKAALGRLGATFYEPALVHARDMFNAIRPKIDEIHESLKPTINAITDMGGAITKKLVKALEAVDFGPVKEGEENVNSATKVVRGFGSVLGVMQSMIAGVIRLVKNVLKAGAPLFSGLLDIAGAIAEVVSAVADMIVETGIFIKIADILGAIIEPIGMLFGGLAKAIGEALQSVTDAITGVAKTDTKGVRTMSDNVVKGLSPLQAVGKAVKAFTDMLQRIISGTVPLFERLVTAVGGGIKTIAESLRKAFEGGSVTKFVDILATSGIFVMAKKIGSFFDGVAKKGKDMKVLSQISGILQELQGVLSSFQKSLDASALIKLAGAIAIFVASLAVLSGLDANGLVKGTMGMAAVLGEMTLALKYMGKVMKDINPLSLIALTTTLTGLGIAMGLFTLSVRGLAQLSWGELIKGLSGLAGMLALVILSAKGLSTVEKPLIRASFGIISFALGLRVLVSSVKALSSIDTEDLGAGLLGLGILLTELALFMKFAKFDEMTIRSGIALMGIATGLVIMSKAVGNLASVDTKGLVKGLGAIAVLLAEIVIFSKFIDPSKAVSTSVGLIGIATSLTIFAKAVRTMGELKLTEVAKGLGGMAGVLTITAVAMKNMPRNIVGLSAGLVIFATSMGIMASSLGKMGRIPLKGLAKGLGGMAGTLTILAVALKQMDGTLKGSAAMVIAAAAIAVLVPPLMLLGSMGLGNIAKALLALAGAFGIFAVAGMAITPVAPVLIGVATAMALLTAGLAALTTGLVTLTGAFANNIFNTITNVVTTLLDVLIQAIPKFVELVVKTLSAMLDAVTTLIPKIITTGAEVILAFLDGMLVHLPKIMDKGVDVVLTFIEGIVRNMNKIVNAAFDLIIAFINGLANAIATRGPELAQAGKNLVVGIIRGITGMFSEMFRSGKEAAGRALRGSKSNQGEFRGVGRNMISGMISGIGSMGNSLWNAAKGMANSAADAIKDTLDIKSPSRVFMRLGEFTGEGFVLGLGVMNDDIYGAGSEMGDSMYSGLEDTIGLFDMDLFNPTITPVLDDEEIRSGLSLLSDEFGDLADKSLGVNGAIESSKRRRAMVNSAKQEVAEANVSFVQNNYSPEALSNTEIYRQTRNQLAMMKGLVKQ